MTEAEINGLDAPASYKKRDSPMNAWLNVISAEVSALK